ncbi:hypothetical protein BJ508DRAFT_162518 [Ascobolus immersus RN42]|uniref:Inclusion body clearance protein IML2 n=1 Tax=Ascobolus immersus RN42 TaxID=1160509 RepID=A0A3N4HW04_ASCIM|nr:hypothetical protein BJ508DRAFT_162518 [Ascobolus immersus RN42]
MFKGAASWLGVGNGKPTAEAIYEPHDGDVNLEQALKAMACIMNDDITGAEVELKDGDSSYHKLARGVIAFLRASLGFEPEVMREAAEKLNLAETSAEKDRQKSVKDNIRRSSYPPGTEFALCAAEAALMGAVVGFLSESLIETMKGVSKLRRAYGTLYAIEAAGTHGSSNLRRDTEGSRSESNMVRLSMEKLSVSHKHSKDGISSVPGSRPPSPPKGNIKTSSLRSKIGSKKSPPGSPTGSKGEPPELDIFISSGLNACFGLLQLILSFIPPSLGRILYAIGYSGDREKGLRMLWDASPVNNVHGAIAALSLLNFYGNALQFCDIIPAENGGMGGFPREKCMEMLNNMKAWYPDSALWHLEDARMLANSKKLEEAVEKLEMPLTTQMRQVHALVVFERALDNLFLHRYEAAAKSFVQMVDLNSWSNVLYYYFAGISYIELYRELKDKDPQKAEEAAKLAEEMLANCPKHMGKKQFLAQSLPLETFADRKIKKWNAASKGPGKSGRIVDGVGASPAAEMIYVWNGFKRMPESAITRTVETLAYPLPAHTAQTDDGLIVSLLSAVTHRYQKNYSECSRLLEEVLASDKKKTKSIPFYDNWVLPTAHYEKAVLLWTTQGKKAREEIRVELKKCGGWESYELETRMGLRVVTGLETLDRLGA